MLKSNPGRKAAILAGLATFLFPFFHALGEAGFRVDESFSGITHVTGPD